MKTIIVLLVVVSVALADDRYHNKYDNVDVDKILQNDRILSNYIKCLLDTGACTAEGRELRKILPDALVTGCTECTKMQKTAAEKVIRHLKAHKAKEWARLIKKYDPNGNYQKRFEAQQATLRA